MIYRSGKSTEYYLIILKGNEINLGNKKDSKNSEKNIPLAEITCTIHENNSISFFFAFINSSI